LFTTNRKPAAANSFAPGPRSSCGGA
jgi:hypothetical protein